MQASALLRLAFADLHDELLQDVDGIQQEELFWQPAPGGNHIGFLLWHIIRDEDAVICQSVLSQAELWITSGWARESQLDDREQGTGFDSTRLETLRFELPRLLDYASAVWRQTDDALAKLNDARLDEGLAWSGSWRLANLLTTGCLSHGWSHLGEVRQLRGLRGWRSRE